MEGWRRERVDDDSGRGGETGLVDVTITDYDDIMA